MKYQIILNFQLEEQDKDRIPEFIEKALDAFRELFPDAKEVREPHEPFATVAWGEDTATEKAKDGDEVIVREVAGEHEGKAAG